MGASTAARLLAALAAQARVEHTPCGDGRMVWHVWGTGPPVLLLHGGSGSWSHWARNVLPLAAAGWQVVVPDLPGNGDSFKPDGVEDADALPPWVERGLAQIVGGSAAIDVVGFSFGTLVACLLAVAHPERVRRLVLAGAPARLENPVPHVGLRPWRHLPPGPERESVHRHNVVAFMFAHADSADDLAVEIHGRNVERDRLTRRKLSRTRLVYDALRALRCPVHAVSGELDGLFRHHWPEVNAALDGVPTLASRQTLAGAGHWVQYEAAEAFNRALLAILGTPCAR